MVLVSLVGVFWERSMVSSIWTLFRWWIDSSRRRTPQNRVARNKRQLVSTAGS